MGITLPVGVANNLNTPGAITDLIANQPSALDIANGTIYIAPDVPAIYTNDNGTWKSLSGGGGGGGLLTADNGLTSNSSTNVQLGGTLIANTSIDVDGSLYEIRNGANLLFDIINDKIGINTINPLFKLDVNGSGRIGNLEINTSSNANYTGVGIKVTGTDKTFQLQGTQKGDINTMFQFASYGGNSEMIDLTNTDSGIIRIYSGFNIPNIPNLAGNVIWLSPTYDFTNNKITEFTGCIVRGLFYNPTIIDLTGTTNVAIETTSGDILLDGFTLLNVTGNNAQVFKIDTSTIDLYSGASGLNINASLGLTTIGDTTSQGNATNIQIFDQSAIIQSIFAGAANGLYVNLANGSYYFGDYASIINASYLHIDANGGTSTLFSNIITLSGGGGSGFFMDLALSRTIIGDYANVGNNSFLKVDDSQGKISLNTTNGLVNISNIQAYQDNAAALAAGLVVGDLYRASGSGFNDFLLIVH